MKRKESLLKLAIIMMIAFTHLAASAQQMHFDAHFDYDYKGVTYKVNFATKKTCAWGLSSINPATTVRIVSFSLTGKQIREHLGVNTGVVINFDGYIVEDDVTYTFTPTTIAQKFAGQSIKKLLISNTVTDIWDYAFKDCTELTTVELSNALTTIRPQLFTGCTKLTTITIPKNITKISKGAFSGCGIKSIVFEEGSNLNTIGEDAFYACEQLKTILLPNGVENLGWNAFASCTSLTSVQLPSSLLILEEGVFLECTSLKSISVPDNVLRIKDGSFCCCTSLSEVKFGSNSQLVCIEHNAFGACSSLKFFEMPDKVATLGEDIFSGTPLEYIKVSAALITLEGGQLDLDKTTLKTLCFGDNSKLKTIESSLFDGFTNLESVDFGKNSALETIESGAFKGCSNLKSIVFPENITTIESMAFYECSSIERLDFPPSITSIGSVAFKCIGLKNIYVHWEENIPDGYDNTFYGGSDGWYVYKNATLHIPVGTESLYKAASPWEIFDNVVPLAPGDPGYAVTINDTNFPDAFFREYVGGNTIDKDQSGKLSEEEMGAVTTIDVNNLQISDLKGIEFFTALTTLSCRFTKLKSIDLSKNTALVDLDCRNNSFTTLDVSKNTELVNLKCARNWITSLDVSNNTKLNMLRCNYNRLTSLDVSKCTKLQRFDCYGNKIGKTAMGNLVASLPSGTNGRFYVIDTTLGTEENVCTTDHVAAAKAKGWTVYDYHDGNSVEYTGSSETVPGDLSGDGELNGTDLVMLTNLILNGQMNTVADLNGDGQVNGTDYVLMVNRILGITSAPMMLAPAMDTTTEANLSIEDFTIEAGETKEMIIDLTNYNDQMTLVQFDLHLPEGLPIVTDGIEIAGRTTWQEHLLYAHDIGNVTRVMLASARNAEISGNSGALISIRLKASDKFDGGDIVIGNTLLVTPRANETQPIDYIYHINGTTGIRSLTPTLSQGEETYYDLSGRPVTNPSKGIYIVNGKRIIINNK